MKTKCGSIPRSSPERGFGLADLSARLIAEKTHPVANFCRSRWIRMWIKTPEPRGHHAANDKAMHLHFHEPLVAQVLSTENIQELQLRPGPLTSSFTDSSFRASRWFKHFRSIIRQIKSVFRVSLEKQGQEWNRLLDWWIKQHCSLVLCWTYTTVVRGSSNWAC